MAKFNENCKSHRHIRSLTDAFSMAFKNLTEANFIKYFLKMGKIWPQGQHCRYAAANLAEVLKCIVLKNLYSIKEFAFSTRGKNNCFQQFCRPFVECWPFY